MTEIEVYIAELSSVVGGPVVWKRDVVRRLSEILQGLRSAEQTAGAAPRTEMRDTPPRGDQAEESGSPQPARPEDIRSVTGGLRDATSLPGWSVLGLPKS